MTLAFEFRTEDLDWMPDPADLDEVASIKRFADTTCRCLPFHWFVRDFLATAGYTVKMVTRLRHPVYALWLANLRRGTSAPQFDADAIERELRILLLRNGIVIQHDSPIVHLAGERITIVFSWEEGRGGKLVLGENGSWNEQVFETFEQVDAALDTDDVAALEYHLQEGLERRVNHILGLMRAQPPF